MTRNQILKQALFGAVLAAQLTGCIYVDHDHHWHWHHDHPAPAVVYVH